ncbi:MAG: SDR family NAD(P)-dependent oxidoreductase [Acidobacteriota bacterium]
MPSFRDSVVLITGAASGIGTALATAAAERGAAVIVTDLDGGGAERVAEGLRKKGFASDSRPLDVTDRSAFKAVVDDVVTSRGRIDFLFNNAGIGVTGEARDLSPDAWDRVIDVNLKGVIHGIQAAYPHMVDRGSGHIANTACVAGLVPFPMTSAYCASKHAVVGLSTSLRAEASSLGVGVSVICPGLVATNMFDHIEYYAVDKATLIQPVERAMVSPERCASQVLRGVERNRAVITVNAHAGLVWWLYRHAPRPFMAVTGYLFKKMRSRLRTPTKP